MTQRNETKTNDERIDSLSFEPLESRDAPSIPPAVMRRLDDLGRGSDLVIRDLRDGGLE